MSSEPQSNCAFDIENATREEIASELERAIAEISHLREALDSNRRIGAATGILMALRGLTQEQAFDLLRRASQHGHRKLRHVAAEVVLTGTLLDLPLPRPTPADELG